MFSFHVKSVTNWNRKCFWTMQCCLHLAKWSSKLAIL